MKATATVVSKILIAAVAGWGFGVFVSQPFVEPPTQESVQPIRPMAYVLIQQNADWNKSNTIKGLDSIENCLYIYEDVTKNPRVRCKLPCITLYKNARLIQRWEGNIMMKNDINPSKVKELIK